MTGIDSFILTDTTTNVEIADWRITSHDLGLTPAVPFTVWKRTLHGGRQEGSTLIGIEAGPLSLSLIPTRGMNPYKVRCDGIPYGWASPVDEVVHPAFVRLGERGGLGWLDGFNELMVRCGYEWSGHPASDESGQWTLHGRAANTPASTVIVDIERTQPHRISISGLIKEKTFKFSDFETWTRLTVTPGERGFVVADRLTNLSDYDRPYQIIYHTNFGRPILEEGARFLAPLARIAPFNEAAKPGIATWPRYLGPTRGYDEMVFACTLHADAEGRTTAALTNADATAGVALDYDTTTLPAFTLWKNTDTERQGYVTGLEPGSNFPYARPVEQRLDRLHTIGAGETRDFNIAVAFLTTPAAVAQTEARIAAIAAGREPVVETEPVYLTANH